jgi:hypothetical protein
MLLASVYMNAFMHTLDLFGLPASRRAVWLCNYRPGLQAYLNRRGLGSKLYAKGHYGWGPTTWRANLNVLIQQFRREEPVVVLEGSLRVQHLAIAKSFRKEAFGDLWVELIHTKWSGYRLNLSAWWVPYTDVY